MKILRARKYLLMISEEETKNWTNNDNNGFSINGENLNSISNNFKKELIIDQTKQIKLNMHEKNKEKFEKKEDLIKISNQYV